MDLSRLLIDPWERARDRYLEDLTEDEMALFSNASLENIFYDASAAQELHQANSRTRALGRKLQPFFNTIEDYGKALDVYSNASFHIMSPLWGSIRVLLHIAAEFEKYFKKLTDMFTRIGDVIPRFQVYQKLFPNQERLLQALSVVYLDIVVFCTNAKAVFRRAKRSSINLRIACKVLWKPFNLQFEEVLDKFREHTKRVEKEAGLSHMIEAADARAIARANRALDEQRRKEGNRMRILAQLSSIQYESKHRRLRKVRHRGTGNWLTEAGEFKDWLTRGRSSCICCHAGSGKSVLASRVVDTLSAIIDNHKKAIAYYYCDYADQKTLATPSILGTIIKQFLGNIPIPDKVERQIEQLYGQGTRTPESQELEAVLYSVIELFFGTYIIIDGLDECAKEDQVEISSIVRRLAMFDKTTVKLYVSSRTESQISTFLNKYPRLNVSVNNISQDIALFVEETVKSKLESQELVIRDRALQTEICSALLRGAHGMFLWVSFQLDDLCEASSDADIRKTLRHLPEGLAETYKRILKKIEENTSRAATACKIFKWIICARRPLLIDELKEAIAFEPADRSWDIKKVPTEGRRLIQSCANLVVVDKDDQSVRLAHHTVQQFLLSWPIGGTLDRFHIQLSQAELEVGEICVTYLSFSDFKWQVTISKPNSTSTHARTFKLLGLDQIPYILGFGNVLLGLWYFVRTKRKIPDIDYLALTRQKNPPSPMLRENYRFLSYAVENWVWHTTKFSEENTSLWQIFRDLAMGTNMAFDVRDWGVNQGPNHLPYLTLFRWAIDSGHSPLLRLLLQPPIGSDLREYCRYESDRGRTPILRVSRRGHASALELLIAVNGLDAKDSRPLLEAVANGHDAVVRLLLEKGADVGAKIASGETLLQWAVSNGHETVVRLLLEKSADIEAKAHDGGTALHRAADKGHEAIVRLLLEKSADVEAKDGDRRTALHRAAGQGHESVVQLLLEKGADVKAKARVGWTALHEAANNGHEAVVLLLLEKGAEIEAKARAGWTALHRAAGHGREAVVRVLLENGADIEAKAHDEGTALHAATGYGHETVVRLLLEKGADIEAKARAGWTALHRAADSGHEAVLRLLLDKNIDIEAEVDDGWTALHRAAWYGHKAAVRLLLEKGADIESKDKDGRTALHFAAEMGHGAVVRLLLERGADIRSKDKDGRTALHFTAKMGHDAVVRLLQEKEADIAAEEFLLPSSPK